MVSRRSLLSTAASTSFLGAGLGVITGRTRASTTDLPASHESTGGKRDDRVQLVEADPEFGFNFSFWLATPETYRSEPVPLLFEMNNADEEDSYDKVKFGRAKSQITDLGFQGAWLSEELGVPHIKPIVPVPNGDPIDATHQTHTFDRETLLLDDTEFERLDRQLLRMADYARQEVLSEITTHEKLLFYGNSSEGVVAERMAAMHPEHIIAAAGGGLNGFVLLPFEDLGGYTLNYPVGVADFEAIIGKAYDRDAHARVDMFYFQGGQDPKNRLKMEGGFGTHLWNDRQVYDAARAVYGADMVEDRFPRCHIAFEKADIDAQFRIYPEMTHNPRPASHDLRSFYEKSIAGEDVSEFGQRLELPLDREPSVVRQERTENGLAVELTVSGAYPPPEGLVSYTWDFEDGDSQTGLGVEHTFERAGRYEITLTMETAHGQRASRSVQQTFFEVSNTQNSASEVWPGDTVSFSADVRNPAQSATSVRVGLQHRDGDGSRETVHSREVDFGPGESKTVTVEETLESPGEYVLTVNGNPVSSPVTVRGTDNPISVVAEIPDKRIEPGEPITIPVTVVFTQLRQSGTFRFPLLANNEVIGRGSAEMIPYSHETIEFEHTFDRAGEYELSAEVGRETVSLGNVTVGAEETQTPTDTPTRTPTSIGEPTSTQTGTSAQTPGFGVLSALAGIGSVASYLSYRTETEDD